jgi:hypothetical protein
MGNLRVGDLVVYEGGIIKHKGEVGTITRINEWYGDTFVSMDLLTPRETYLSPTAKSTLTAVTAPFKFFKLWKQGWEL